ncbi:hypothetical protein RRG08_001430 [Elysia crispata]|uniref:Uncharacterized protein n=1 Tax=Elysia crispata TaxID=231223 RepID=A0AAE1DK83_9GAST|nr:hypothetical protein RRG08_001430 [Elysia crispata]
MRSASFYFKSEMGGQIHLDRALKPTRETFLSQCLLPQSLVLRLSLALARSAELLARFRVSDTRTALLAERAVRAWGESKTRRQVFCTKGDNEDLVVASYRHVVFISLVFCPRRTRRVCFSQGHSCPEQGYLDLDQRFRTAITVWCLFHVTEEGTYAFQRKSMSILSDTISTDCSPCFPQQIGWLYDISVQEEQSPEL